MKESVIILGGSLLQVKAIEEARKEGLIAIVIDGNANVIKQMQVEYNKLTFFFSDNRCIFKNIDLKDKEAILSYAKSLNKTHDIIGVFTCGTDFSATASYVAEGLGVQEGKCHTYKAALNASIKTRMRECFKEDGVNSPRFFECKTEEEVKKACDKLGYPAVIKPVDNMGARGCRAIRKESEVGRAFTNAVREARSGCVIVEEYLDGKEYSIDALLYKNTLTVTGLAIRHIEFFPYFVEMGHSMPFSSCEEDGGGEIKTLIVKELARAVRALGLTTGAVKGDIKVVGGRAYIGEVAARLSGGFMSSYTYPLASDFPLIKEALRISCGREPEELLKRRLELNKDICTLAIYEVPCKLVSCERAIISIPGSIEKITGIKEVREEEGVKEVFLRPKSLIKEVCFPHNNVEKVGNVITLSSTYEEARKKAYKAIRSIFIKLTPNNKRTSSFLIGEEEEEEEGFPPSAYSLYKTLKEEELVGVIEKDCPASSSIPSIIQEYISNNPSEVDWNYRTLKESIKEFDTLCPLHPRLNAKEFYLSLARGGLQGAVYYAESAKEKE